MKERRWFLFFKFLNNQASAYLYSLLSPPNRHCNTRITKLNRFSAEQKLLLILFCIRQLENGTNLIPESVKLLHIRYFASTFIQPTANSTFGTNDISPLKLLTRLRVGFSHLREHKFK